MIQSAEFNVSFDDRIIEFQFLFFLIIYHYCHNYGRIGLLSRHCGNKFGIKQFYKN